MTRQIKKIRNGRKHGPVSSFVSATNIEELNPFVLWDHFYLPQVEGTAGSTFTVTQALPPLATLKLVI